MQASPPKAPKRYKGVVYREKIKLWDALFVVGKQVRHSSVR